MAKADNGFADIGVGALYHIECNVGNADAVHRMACMTLALDLPPCQPSFVQRMDPRWKLAGLVLAAVTFAIFRTIGPALIALAGAVAIVAFARLSWSWYLRRLGVAMTMYALFLVWLPLFPQEGHDTFALGPITISLTDLRRLLVLTAN